jgi:hypothetical protein
VDKQKITLTAGLLAAALGIKLIYNVVYTVAHFFTGAGDIFGADYGIYTRPMISLIVYPAWYGLALMLLILLVVAAAASATKGGRAAYFWLAAVDGYVIITALITVIGTIMTFIVGGLVGEPASLLPMFTRLLDGLVGLFALAVAVVPTYLLIAYFRQGFFKKESGFSGPIDNG